MVNRKTSDHYGRDNNANEYSHGHEPFQSKIRDNVNGYNGKQPRQNIQLNVLYMQLLLAVIVGLCFSICIVTAISHHDYFKTNNKGEDSGIIELETHKYSDDKLHCEYMNNKYQHKLNWD
eukprot:121438_1